MTNFPVGSQFTYIELEENDISKRFIVPTYSDIRQRLAILIVGLPKVTLKNLGAATIASIATDDIDSVTGLQALPSTVTAMYNVMLLDHPVLSGQESKARYSEELSGLIAQAQPNALPAGFETQPLSPPFNVPAIAPFIPAAAPLTQPEAPKVDLTQALRSQMLQKKAQEHAAPAQPPAPVVVPAPVQTTPAQFDPNAPPPGQMKLEEFLEVEKAKKEELVLTKSEVNQSLKPQPLGKIDILLAEVQELRRDVAFIKEHFGANNTEEIFTAIREIKTSLGL